MNMSRRRTNDSLADEVPGYIIDEFLPFVANVLSGTHEIGQKAISTIQSLRLKAADGPP
jgi:hypothetical protein